MGYPRGVKELRSYSYGKKLTLKQSVLAKCAECSGNYVDGKEDCDIPGCPLYQFMVYGAVWKGRERKLMSPDQANSARLRLKQARMKRI
jgi:hypothetical protein